MFHRHQWGPRKEVIEFFFELFPYRLEARRCKKCRRVEFKIVPSKECARMKARLACPECEIINVVEPKPGPVICEHCGAKITEVTSYNAKLQAAH